MTDSRNFTTDFDKIIHESPEIVAKLNALDLIDRARGEGVGAVAAFGEYVFGVKPAGHHRKWLKAKLTNKRVVIVAPPESGKTIWAMILMAWGIGKAAWKTNAFISATEGAANAMAKTVADCIEFNARWKEVFPSVVPNKEKGWSRDGYEVLDTSIPSDEWTRLVATKKDPTLLAGGVGSARLNGIRITGRLDCDDIHDRDSMTSDRVCLDTVSFVRDTVLSRVTEDAYFAMEQTRWNSKDSVAYIKTLAGMYVVFEHPAIDPVTGESYWEEQWSLERLANKRREVTELVFQLVYLGNDKAAEGQILKGSWLIEFPATYIKREYERFFGIDFARTMRELTGSKSKDPDFFALAVIVNTNPVLVVEDGIKERFVMGDAEDEFFRMAAIYNPKVTGVEVNGAGYEYYVNLLRRMGLKGIRYYIKPIKTTKNKGDRITNMAGDFQYGMIKISDAPQPFLRDFRNEWLRFGAAGTHDDTLDAVYFARDAASYLLPVEDRERTIERLERQANTVNPMLAIEAAYYG